MYDSTDSQASDSGQILADELETLWKDYMTLPLLEATSNYSPNASASNSCIAGRRASRRFSSER